MLISIPRKLRSLYGHQKSYATPALHARPTHVFPEIGSDANHTQMAVHPVVREPLICKNVIVERQKILYLGDVSSSFTFNGFFFFFLDILFQSPSLLFIDAFGCVVSDNLGVCQHVHPLLFPSQKSIECHADSFFFTAALDKFN